MCDAPKRWQDDAACKDVGWEIFYPPIGGSADKALAYCERCPVTVQCLFAAFEEGDKWSVRGGMTANARRLWARGRPHKGVCPVCRIDFLGKRGQSTCGERACLDELAARRNRKSTSDHRRNGG